MRSLGTSPPPARRSCSSTSAPLAGPQFPLPPRRHLGELLLRHRAVLGGGRQPRHDLLAVEHLGLTRALDDQERHLVDPLERGEAALAGEALPSPTDRRAVV